MRPYGRSVHHSGGEGDRDRELNLLRANGVATVSEAIYTNALSLDQLLALGAE